MKSCDRSIKIINFCGNFDPVKKNSPSPGVVNIYSPSTIPICSKFWLFTHFARFFVHTEWFLYIFWHMNCWLRRPIRSPSDFASFRLLHHRIRAVILSRLFEFWNVTTYYTTRTRSKLTLSFQLTTIRRKKHRRNFPGKKFNCVMSQKWQKVTLMRLKQHVQTSTSRNDECPGTRFCGFPAFFSMVLAEIS